MILRQVAIGSVLFLTLLVAAGAGEPEVGFAKKPSVEKAGDDRTISFAANKPCDMAVGIIDKDGKMVRHLAAGMIGTEAVTAVWDGKDDFGKPVGKGCRVRVDLGLSVKFERMLCEVPQGISSRGPVGMATDEAGNLYIMEGHMSVGKSSMEMKLKMFDRDGNYLKTLYPFPPDLPEEKLSMVEFITTKDGRRVPLSGFGGHRPYSGFVPGNPGTMRHTPVVSKDGKYIFVTGSIVAGGRRVLRMGTDGSVTLRDYPGPELHENARYSELFLALSPDEKYVYYAGAISKKGGKVHAVYRADLEADAQARPFIGTPFESGDDEKHFNDPRGLATDPKGRIYVGDYANDRVQVFEANGTFVKSLPVTGPEQVLVHPKTGAVYVFSVKDRGAINTYTKKVQWEVYENKSIVKFPSIDEWKEACRIDLPRRKKHMHDAGPIMVLDRTAEHPAIWIANVGRQEPEDMLWKIVDRGDRLEKVEHSVRRYSRGQMLIGPKIAADHDNNELLAVGGGLPKPVRIDAKTGKETPIELKGEIGATAMKGVGDIAVGPGGMLYVRTSKPIEKPRGQLWLIRRFDRDGNHVPFEKAGEYIETHGKQEITMWGGLAAPFSVDRNGNIYVVGLVSRKTLRCRLDVYGPDGAMKKKGLMMMSHTGGCVAADAAGRLYVAETLRPMRVRYPNFYPADPNDYFRKWYGVLLRMSPEGGAIEPAAGLHHDYVGRYNRPVKVTGARWGFYGISPMPQNAGCQCRMAYFDVDEWGRVWMPDEVGFCITVLESSGKAVTRFGSYGNWDCKGEGSKTPVPPIPLWGPGRIAVLDDHAFIADSHSRRIVQVKLGSRAREEVAVQ